MVTAYSHDDVAKLIIEVGIKHLLTKPVSELTLHNIIIESLFNDEEYCKIPNKIIDQNSHSNSVKIHDANILLVDDNAINREIAIEFLKETKVNIDIAVDGLEAIEKIRTGKYQLVFMDIQMPKMDGITATKVIRSDEAYKDLPIIAMTANAMVDDYEDSLGAGMNDHITKPFHPEMLFDILAKWLT